MDWRERYERAAARYAAGETRELDERQLVQLANSAWAAGLSLLMGGEREEAADWLRRSAARYRESWDAGGRTDAWGRPIGAIKALLIAGDGRACNNLLLAGQWALAAGAAEAESVIGRYAGVLALLALDRDEDAGALVATLGDGFPSDVAAALAALAAHDADAYAEAAERVLRSFHEQTRFLEDIPVSDTKLALDVLAERRRICP